MTSSLDASSLLFPISDDASSSDQYPLTFLESELPDCSVQDTAPGGCHDSIDENDIVVAVMGLTGAGKSSFVNEAAGKTRVLIGNDLLSRTRAVQPIRCRHPDGLRNIILVDTPGFDDTHLSDAEILRTIANWLKKTYQKNIKLSGILYLHRISDVRMAGTPLRNLAVFKDLCGKNNLKNIVLVTTMWDEVEGEMIGSEREEELLSTFWKDMIRLGSRTCRYQGTPKSAWEIIDQLGLEESPKRLAPLQIQREMVDCGLPLHETTAAKTLLRSLGEQFRKIWAKIRGRARRPISPGRPTGGFRQTIFRRSSIRSGSSQGSLSVVSLSDTSSTASRDSTPSSSPTDSTSSGCTPFSRRDALTATIRGLRIAHELAALSPIPMLRGAIGTVLCIAKLIEEMDGAHHAISQVVENSGWLLEETRQYAMKFKLSKDMNKALHSFQRELKHLQNVVRKIENRGTISRFLLHDADIQAIAACNNSIKIIYDKLGLKLAMDSYQAIARLQDEIMLLRDHREPWKCECGSGVVCEENEESFGIASQAGP